MPFLQDDRTNLLQNWWICFCDYCSSLPYIYMACIYKFDDVPRMLYFQAFPKNSTWVSSFSAAILQVTQNVTMFCDLKKNISLPITVDKSEYKSNVEWRSLTIDDFGGLFPMVLSVLVLFFSLSILKVPCITRWLENKLVSSWTVSGGGVIFICS